MGIFIAISALLSILVFAVLLRPLWSHARPLAAGLTVILLASTALLYALIGTPHALDPVARKAPETLQEAVAQLKSALARDPQQAEGWVLLAQVYQRQNDLANARDAFAKAAKLAPDNPDILAEAAQARALAHPDRRFDTEAQTLLQNALKQDPQHQRARWFLGVALRQAGQHAKAASMWEPLLNQLETSTANNLREEINDARQMAGLEPLSEPVTAQPLLHLNVQLSPAAQEYAKQFDTPHLFIIARQINGAPMPVAAQKHAAPQFPLAITLSDADSPMPTLKLSQLEDVELLARLGNSADASQQQNAMQSAVVRVHQPAQLAITLTIDAP